jgi:hypothetical protein
MAIKPGTKIGRHGLSKTPEHRNWRNMLDRCTNPKCKYYPSYGGRGISVCDRWMGPHGFANFYADMGPKQDPTFSVERIDNDKGYEPGNCKWGTKLEQSRNRRNCLSLEKVAEVRRYPNIAGSELATYFGCSPSSIYRIRRADKAAQKECSNAE